MNKKIWVGIGAILVAIFLVYMLMAIIDMITPIVYAIGWIVLTIVMGAGIFFITKFMIKLFSE